MNDDPFGVFSSMRDAAAVGLAVGLTAESDRALRAAEADADARVAELAAIVQRAVSIGDRWRLYSESLERRLRETQEELATKTQEIELKEQVRQLQEVDLNRLKRGVRYCAAVSAAYEQLYQRLVGEIGKVSRQENFPSLDLEERKKLVEQSFDAFMESKKHMHIPMLSDFPRPPVL